MVGVGWLVIMDDWLLRGGALGALLGFVIGGALLLPIGWVYGKLVIAMPDAAGEVAYTSAVFPRSISFATGWMMTLAYFIVCPWEAVAVGRIAGYIIPGLDSLELYRIAGRPVYPASPRHRACSDRAAYAPELSRHPPQRHLSELDQFRHPRSVLHLRSPRRKPRLAGEYSRRCSRIRRWSPSCSSSRSSPIS